MQRREERDVDPTELETNVHKQAESRWRAEEGDREEDQGGHGGCDGRDKEAAAAATQGVAKEFFHQGKAKQVRNCTHCKKPGVPKLDIERQRRRPKGRK